MIQRKQTLFLFVSALMGLSLLFIPNQTLITPTGPTDVVLIPLQEPFISTPLHLLTIGLNFLTLLVAFVAVFLYKKRELQVKLCYTLMVFWLVITVLMGAAKFAELKEPVTAVDKTYIAMMMGILGMIASYIAARFIKKDIELLKSADRIR